MTINNTNYENLSDKLLEMIEQQKESTEIMSFIEGHPSHRNELLDLYSQWNAMGELEFPQPSSTMDAGFYKMLSELNTSELPKETKTISLWDKYRNNLFTLGIAASIFMAGMFISKFMGENTVSSDKSLVPETQAVNFSSPEFSIQRLGEINELEDAENLDQKIIDALNDALTKDPNVNVRLSAIEAMLHFADDPQVRQNLIAAIPFQDSPIVQLTLAEVMISLEEKSSKDEWEKLFSTQPMEKDVKKQLQETLKEIY